MQRLIKLVNENDEAYSFNYDRNDNVVEEIGLDGVMRKIEHGARDLPVKVINAANEADAITLDMERDALGRLTLRAPNKTFRARRGVEDSTLVRRDAATQPWRFC